MSYRIKTVSTLTGISTATLRAWERRYAIVTPQRSEGGYRTYTDADVARLRRVKALVDRGYKVGEAVTFLDEGSDAPPPLSGGLGAPEETGEALLEALLDMDRARADRLAERLAQLPYERRIDEVLFPLLQEVGERWASGRASVAQEHFAATFVREKLVGMLEELSAGPSGGEEAVLAGAPGEQHELGLLAAAIHLALRGWRVVYLGADVPIADLGSVLRARAPALVCSSILTPRDAGEMLALARSVRAAAPERTRVVFGGAGVPEAVLGEPARGLHLLASIGELLALEGVSPTRNGR